VVGRLRDGVTREEAQAEMNALARRLAGAYPVENADAGVNIVPLREALNFAHEMFKLYSSALVLAGLLVLGMACLNLSTLFLARVLSGRRELAVRVALGASRRRLISQTFFESLLIALFAGAGGLALGSAVSKGFESGVPADLYRVGTIGVDATVVIATVVLSLLTAILFGALPALRAGRSEAWTTLKDGGIAASSHDALKMQRGLVVTQMALAVVLLVGTLLGARSFSSLQDVDLGFDPDGIATMQVVLPEPRYGTPDQRAAFHAAVVERVAAISGVRAAATVDLLPLNHEMNALEVREPGAEVTRDLAPTASTLRITPGYFDVMRIPLLAGESFRDGAGVASEPVVIVNQRLAGRIWPGADPLGRMLLIEGEDAPRRVIGVAGATVHWEIAGERPLQMYIPALASPGSYFRILARHEPGIAGGMAAIREAIAEIDPTLPVTETRTMRAVVDEYLQPHGLVVVALTILSAGALLLAVIGVYGIMTFLVSRDRRSIGIRMAVGASRGVVVREIVRRGLTLAAWGAAIGLAGAVALGSVLRGALYGVSVYDPITLAAVPLLLAAVAALASIVPALRASRIDPIETLRAE
ncbi:MAG: FtsX-like permease family protein, partial [Thermoanaerobaculia bacterium]